MFFCKIFLGLIFFCNTQDIFEIAEVLVNYTEKFINANLWPKKKLAADRMPSNIKLSQLLDSWAISLCEKVSK